MAKQKLEAYIVAVGGNHVGKPHRSRETAISIAIGNPGATVTHWTFDGDYNTEQRVWPIAGEIVSRLSDEPKWKESELV